MSNLLNKLGFAAVEIALAPVTAAGYLATATGVGWASRRDKTSMTAASPLGLRWLLHETGRREDEAARRLFLRLLGMSDRPSFRWS